MELVKSQARNEITVDDGFLRIGLVCKLFGISPDTLRLYEKKGLLQPALVKESSYRYYGIDQLDTLNEILACKLAGFSLKEIAAMVNAKDLDTQYAMLCAQNQRLEHERAKIERTIACTERRLSDLQFVRDTPRGKAVFSRLDPTSMLYRMELVVLLQVGSDASDIEGMTELASWHAYRFDDCDTTRGEEPELLRDEGVICFSFDASVRDSALKREMDALVRAGGAEIVAMERDWRMLMVWGAEQETMGAVADACGRPRAGSGEEIYLSRTMLPAGEDGPCCLVKALVPCVS